FLALGRGELPRLGFPRRFLDRGNEASDARGRGVVFLPQIRAVGHAHIVDDLDRVLQVVEGDEGLDEDEKNLRQAVRVALRVSDAVESSDRVVGDVAERAAEKRRDAVDRDRALLLEQLFQNAQRLVGRERSFLSVFDDLDIPAARLEDEVWPRAEKRVARPALAALNTFKQKGVAVPLEAPEKRERRLEVHQQLLVNRYQVSLLRQAREFFERRMHHV